MGTLATNLEYRKVRLKDIVVREPIRTDINPAKIAELAEDLKVRGLLEPIVVRLEDDKPVLVAGLRRTKAAEKLGWTEIDAHIVAMSADEARAAQLAENIKRTDLSPMDYARAVNVYVEVRRKATPAVTLEVLGKELGVSQSEVSNTMKLLKMDTHIQALLDRGRISPGHVEHVLGPLEGQLTTEELVKFAAEIARQNLPVAVAQQEAKDVLRRHEWEAKQAELKDRVKAAKVKKCPTCKDRAYGGEPQGFVEIGGRVVFADQDADYPSGHRWFADTGELYKTPAEKRRDEEVARATEKAQKLSAEARKKAGAKREKVVRDYAVFFSRAPIDKWAQALLDVGKESLRGMTIGLTYGGVNWDINEDQGGGLVVDAAFKVPKPVRFSTAEVSDGGKGRFLTRVQIGYYRSTPSEDDHVAEGPDVTKLRKLRGEILAFQRKDVGVRQAEGDLWPTNAGGFSIGEKVKIGEKAGWSSYVGKQGPILAFDVKNKELVAVLDIAAAHKRHEVSTLKKIEVRQKATRDKKAKGTPKGRAK